MAEFFEVKYTTARPEPMTTTNQLAATGRSTRVESESIMSRTILVVSLGALLLSGCAIQQKKVIYTLEHPAPVNCAAAEGDLRVLQSEKAHVAQQIAEGALSLTPVELRSAFSR